MHEKRKQKQMNSAYMKANNKQRINLIDRGKVNWERTDEFKKKVSEIRQELLDKYKPLLSSEKNWFKLLLIKIRIWLETKKRIDVLSSRRNLHFEAR
jgi:hypothetical protein